MCFSFNGNLEMQIYPISAQKVKFGLLSCTLSETLYSIIKGKKKENLIQSRFCLSNFPLNVKCTLRGHRNIWVYFQSIIRTHQPGPRRCLPILIYNSLELSSNVSCTASFALWWLIRPQSLQNWTQLRNRYAVMHYVTKQTVGAPRSQTLKMVSFKTIFANY